MHIWRLWRLTTYNVRFADNTKGLMVEIMVDKDQGCSDLQRYDLWTWKAFGDYNGFNLLDPQKQRQQQKEK